MKNIKNSRFNNLIRRKTNEDELELEMNTYCKSLVHNESRAVRANIHKVLILNIMNVL